jgi:hypothetical protein
MTSNGTAPRIASLVPANGTEHTPTAQLPSPEDSARIAGFLREHPSWTAFWDKQACPWRVTEDDPDSALQAASSDTSTVIAFMAEHALDPRAICQM